MTDDEKKKEANEHYREWVSSAEMQISMMLAEEIRKEIDEDVLKAMNDFIRKKIEHYENSHYNGHTLRRSK